MEKQEKAFTIRIALDLLETMRSIAHAHNRSLNGEILTALQEYIERYKQGKEQGLKPNTPDHCR